MTLITIHQPNYLPWSGFFHKWMISDAFIILDTVQYHKNEWQNRNRIKTRQGAQWLTVPVSYRFPQTIQEVGIASQAWARKQMAAVEQAYSKAPFFQDYYPSLQVLWQQPWEKIADLNVAVIRLLGDMLGCDAPLLLASEMTTESDDPTQRLIQLCQEVKGTAYLSGSEGRNYLQKDVFESSGLDLYFQAVEAPIYPQLHGEFIPYLTALDVLMNTGPEAKHIIRRMGGKVGE
ncbi:MAG: WbqC family protein [Mariprofundaceae bacterium]|nr:WbqC family protein [Mariprofundaceae bacterium]